MSASEQDEDVQQVSSGASLSYPLQCSALRKGGYVLMKDKPCKIMEIKVSKVGKHGHAKAHITGLDIFTEKRYEMINPSSHTVSVPHVAKKEYLIVEMDGNHMCLMMDNGDTFDVLYDEKSCNQGTPATEINAALADQEKQDSYYATVLSAMGNEVVKEVKKGNK